MGMYADNGDLQYHQEAQAISSLEIRSISSSTEISNPLELDLNLLNQQIVDGLTLEVQFTLGSAAFDEAAKLVKEAAKAASIIANAITDGKTRLSPYEQEKIGEVAASTQDQIYKISADIKSGSISSQEGNQLLDHFATILNLCRGFEVEGV